MSSTLHTQPGFTIYVKLLIVFGVIDLVLCILISIMPIPTVSRLKFSYKTRMSLGGFGILLIIFYILVPTVRIGMLLELCIRNESDTYQGPHSSYSTVNFLSHMEAYTSVTIACIPFLRTQFISWIQAISNPITRTLSNRHSKSNASTTLRLEQINTKYEPASPVTDEEKLIATMTKKDGGVAEEEDLDNEKKPLVPSRSLDGENMEPESPPPAYMPTPEDYRLSSPMKPGDFVLKLYTC
jgi:hypothetical protein